MSSESPSLTTSYQEANVNIFVVISERRYIDAKQLYQVGVNWKTHRSTLVVPRRLPPECSSCRARTLGHSPRPLATSSKTARRTRTGKIQLKIRLKKLLASLFSKRACISTRLTLWCWLIMQSSHTFTWCTKQKRFVTRRFWHLHRPIA